MEKHIREHVFPNLDGFKKNHRTHLCSHSKASCPAATAKWCLPTGSVPGHWAWPQQWIMASFYVQDWSDPCRFQGSNLTASLRGLWSMPDVTYLHGQIKGPSCQSVKQSDLLQWTHRSDPWGDYITTTTTGNAENDIFKGPMWDI